MNWFIHLWRSSGGRKHIAPGVRVKTPWGSGIVMTGQLNVMLDEDNKHPNARHHNERTVTCSLAAISF